MSHNSPRNQHYLLAALIGGFSAATSGPLRTHMVWVRRRGIQRPYRQRAENVACARDFYTLLNGVNGTGQRAEMVDREWALYEKQLPAAIAALVNSSASSLPGQFWIKNLVPFVSSLFVRGPDFNRRFEARSVVTSTRDYLGPEGFQDNTNMARLFEWQRLMFPVACAEWTVVHLPRHVPAITSDIGFCLMRQVTGGPVGYAIPLRCDALLVLSTGPRFMWMHWNGADWVVDGVRHVVVSSENAMDFNRAMAGTATEVYGPSEVVVGASTQVWEEHYPNRQTAPGADLLVPEPQRLREHEMFLYQMLTVIAAPPGIDEPALYRMR